MIWIAAGLCLLLAAPARLLAAGDGFEFGPLRVSPGVTITETYDDNIYLTSHDEESDWVTTISPALKLALALPIRPWFVRLGGQLDFGSYANQDGQNATNWSVDGAVGADFPGGLSFEVSEQYADRFLTTTQEFGPGERSSRGTTQAKVAYAIRHALRVELAWSSNLYLFDASKDRERIQSAVQAGLFWKFLPRTSALVAVGKRDFSYESNKAQDSAAVHVAAGITWEVTSKSTGLIKAGWEWKTFDHEDAANGFEDASYSVVSVGLRHFFTSRTTGEIEASRGSEESDFPGNPYFLRSALAAGASHRFTYKIYGRAAVKFAQEAYPHETTYTNPFDPAAAAEVGTRTDNVVGGTVALGYDLQRWLTFEVGYATERRTSNFDTFEYTVNRFTLTAKAAF